MSDQFHVIIKGMMNTFKPDGAVIPLNEVGVPPSNETGWTRKQDVARSFDVDVRTIERAVNSLGTETEFHTQKGGYHNVEVLYDDYLVNAIGKQLKVNAISQGKQSEVIKQDNAQDLQIAEVYKDMGNEAGWTRKQDVANSFNVTERTLQNVVNSLGTETEFHTQKGGYHNSEVYYDDYLVNAIGMKLKVNAISQGKQSEVIKRDNAQDIVANSLMKNGSPEAKRALAQILLDMADQDELLQQSQQTIKALTDENKALIDERDAAVAETEEIYQYNDNFHNHMYTATELGKRYNESHITVGRIATQLNLKQCPKYCVMGKTEAPNGMWVDKYYYNDTAVAILDKHFGYSALL